jgi:hypothetical protein
MSEKLYALLLRFHSSRFLRDYGDEALQLFRDRAHHERGFWARLRLWLDLLADLAISIPHGYVAMKPRFSMGTTPGELDGVPSFRLLGQKPLNRGALALGVALSLILLVTVLLDTGALPHEIVGLIAHGETSQPLAGVWPSAGISSPAPSQHGQQKPQTVQGLARYRYAMERDNCTFEKVLILQHNIGYLKLNSFPDPFVCGATARASMTSLNGADSIIFDLRDNGGGDPEMVTRIVAYLFDHSEYIYNPGKNLSWTPSPVVGNRLADKPAYILISTRTIAAAEQFAFDLKMLKRATLVGEPTPGSAQAPVFSSDHRWSRHGNGGDESVYPHSKSDWGGISVEPDVRVKESVALETAVTLAETRLPESQTTRQSQH